jgi:hypothetical protein
MAEGHRLKRQKAICAMCGEPIGEGDAIRRLTFSEHSRVLPAHPRCYERDWETIESGLEPFPVLVSSAGQLQPATSSYY